jgi:hypothetical protein
VDFCIGPHRSLYTAGLSRSNGEGVDRCTSSLQTSATGRRKGRSSLRLRQWQLGIEGPGSQASRSRRICHWATLCRSYLATHCGSWVEGKAVAKQIASDTTGVPWLLLESVDSTGNLRPSGHHVHSVASKESRRSAQLPLTARCTSHTPARLQFPALSRVWKRPSATRRRL